MELGAFNLEDYIGSQFSSVEVPDLGIDWACCRSPSLVPRNCSPITRLKNWCTIGAHIVSGLSYMHSLRYVQPDLKPANGTNQNKASESA